MFCLLYTDLQARRFFEKSTRWSSCTAVARQFLISNTRSCESASRDIYGGTERTTPATQIQPEVLKVPRLPRKRCRRQWAPVRRQASADIYGGTERTTPATQIQPEVLKVPRLPRERCRRQWAPVRRQASTDIYGGTERTTPATQNRTYHTCHTNPA